MTMRQMLCSHVMLTLFLVHFEVPFLFHSKQILNVCFLYRQVSMIINQKMNLLTRKNRELWYFSTNDSQFFILRTFLSLNMTNLVCFLCNISSGKFTKLVNIYLCDVHKVKFVYSYSSLHIIFAFSQEMFSSFFPSGIQVSRKKEFSFRAVKNVKNDR